MKARRQEPPFAVQIEPSQGCNLGCDFCGIHAIGYQKKKRGTDLMSIETARSIAAQMIQWDWNPRIEFAMHGEPTMHPALDVLIATFREALPRGYIMVTSNGGGLLGGDVAGKVLGLFEAGLNTLALDNYESVSIVPKILEKLGDEFPVPIKHYPLDKTASPHTRHRKQLISVVQDISVADDGTHSHLNNHAGSAFPKNYEHNSARCAKPFREMSIRWDGSVAICCNDWPGYYHCGNVVTDGLDKVWNGPAFAAARKVLYHGKRGMIKPCNGCDALSYRVGLLPDKLGRESLPTPDATTKRAIELAQAKGPFTVPVRPPMEA